MLLNTSLRNSHYLAVDISGGLGNIMFQYAGLYAISKSNAMIPVLDENSKLLTIFPYLSATPLREIQSVGLWSRFIEDEQTKYDKRLLSLNFGKNILLRGRFQSWRYFDHSKHELHKQFAFLLTTEDTAEQFLTNAHILHRERFPNTNADVKFIGIHIERGDNKNEGGTDRGLVAVSLDYIKRAMNYFGAKFQHIIFVVTSDDKKWDKQYVKSRRHIVVFPPHKSASLDLCILSKCNHTIITAGTFGWWAAFLANGGTLYPKNFPSKYSSPSNGFMQRDFYYPHWIGL